MNEEKGLTGKCQKLGAHSAAFCLHTGLFLKKVNRKAEER